MLLTSSFPLCGFALLVPNIPKVDGAAVEIVEPKPSDGELFKLPNVPVCPKPPVELVLTPEIGPVLKPLS